MAIEIVPIRSEHVEGYHAALDAVARERRFLAFLEAPPIETTRAFVGLVLTGRLFQHVALADGEVVGWCDILRGERETMQHAGMLGVGIAAPYRGHGLGARLMTSVMQEARSADVTRVALQVRADNVRAIRLYERLGFRREGVLRRHLRVDGVMYDTVAMAILFDEAAAA